MIYSFKFDDQVPSFVANCTYAICSQSPFASAARGLKTTESTSLRIVHCEKTAIDRLSRSRTFSLILSLHFLYSPAFSCCLNLPPMRVLAAGVASQRRVVSLHLYDPLLTEEFLPSGNHRCWPGGFEKRQRVSPSRLANQGFRASPCRRRHMGPDVSSRLLF